MGLGGRGLGGQNSLGGVFKAPGASERQSAVVLTGDQSAPTVLTLLAAVSDG